MGCIVHDIWLVIALKNTNRLDFQGDWYGLCSAALCLKSTQGLMNFDVFLAKLANVLF